MDIIKAFCEAYGFSFLTLVIFGVLGGLFLEVTIKKALTSAIKKAEGSSKLEKTKSVVYTIFAVTFSIWFAMGVYNEMPLPCGAMAIPAWVFIVYISQYVTSLYGIKGIQGYAEKRARKALESKDEPVLFPTAIKGVYKNKDGQLCDKHGCAISL